MKSYLNTVLISLLLFACKKEKGIVYPVNSSSSYINACYDAYSTDQFSAKFKNLVSGSLIGPQLYFPKDLYYRPCFNPNNANEIMYMLASSTPSMSNGIYKFNFCDGTKTLITSDIGSDFDWGPNGWVVFSSASLQLYKIKDNGDSLTKLSKQGGSNFDGKWSPDGSKIFYINNTTRVIDKNGNNEIDIQTTTFRAIDWIDNKTLLVFKSGINRFCKFDIETKTISGPICSYTTAYTDPKTFDRKNNVCYLSKNNGSGTKDYFLKYDFNYNRLDTLKILHDSYFYGIGDYSPATNKTVIQLIQQDWKDSLKGEINYFQDIIVMNPNGTKERLVKIE